MHTTDLGGHSGCRIILCEADNGQMFVRKISSDLNYNKRLILQTEKQKCFVSSKVKTPAVLDTGYTETGLFYFDMEYIQGITMAEYMKSIEIDKIQTFVETIIDSIAERETTGEPVDENVFINKIQMLEERLRDRHEPVIDEALSFLKAHSWVDFNKTPCHGDLTLENIIVKDNQLFFIDFLDSFCDSWIMDVSTIMQDVQTLWSYRMQDEIDINTIIRLIVFRDILLDKLRSRLGSNLIDIYYALLLKLVRIYPYVVDKRTYNYLNEKTRSVMDIIKGMYQ